MNGINIQGIFFFIFTFIYFSEAERDRAQVGEEQRERETQIPKQAPGCQHRARHGARTHKL